MSFKKEGWDDCGGGGDEACTRKINTDLHVYFLEYVFCGPHNSIRTYISYIASRVVNCAYARQNSCTGYLYVYLCTYIFSHSVRGPLITVHMYDVVAPAATGDI